MAAVRVVFEREVRETPLPEDGQAYRTFEEAFQAWFAGHRLPGPEDKAVIKTAWTDEVRAHYRTLLPPGCTRRVSIGGGRSALAVPNDLDEAIMDRALRPLRERLEAERERLQRLGISGPLRP